MCDLLPGIIKGELVDEVTRLPNKAFFQKFLKEADGNFKIIDINVDIENLNEKFEDIVLSKIASVIKHSVRIPKDFVVRTGNHSFAVILGDKDEGVAKIVAERIKTNLSYLNIGVGGKPVRIYPVVNIKS
jgi:PleD family two-component response regulator